MQKIVDGKGLNPAKCLTSDNVISNIISKKIGFYNLINFYLGTIFCMCHPAFRKERYLLS